jgi:citrate lyase subunit beta/citryl-CoA lyase
MNPLPHLDTPRVALSVPGDRPDRFPAAVASGADMVIFDLEDAVAPNRKDRAREEVLTFVGSVEAGGVQLVVRVNALGTPWGSKDIPSLGPLSRQLTAVIIPKTESARDVTTATALLDSVAEDGCVGVFALLETARGVMQASSIAGAGGRLRGLVLGYADLAADLGRTLDDDPSRWTGIQDRVLLAARAHSLCALDGPYLGTAADEGFAVATRHAQQMGFDGKWVIHPRQVAPVVEAFQPSAAEVSRAWSVLDALAADAHGGKLGVVQLDGQMIDEAVAAIARRTLARHRVSGDG